MLLHLAVILVSAKVAAELCERIRVPAVVGEIVVGMLIGPSVLGWVPGDSAAVTTVAELGVLLLLVQVGMEMDVAELGKVGRASITVAVIGVVVPFALGGIVVLGFGEDGNTALFVGAALTATSVGITARVFGDLKALATTEARIVLGAAVADDVLGLVILTVVVKIVTDGSVGVGTVAQTVGTATSFLIIAGLVGVLVVPWCFERLARTSRSGATVVVLGLALTLGFSWAASWAKLAPIIGAFVAGVAIGRSSQHARIERELGSTANLFVPVFFVQIGLHADLSAMARPAVIGLAGALCVVAVGGKLVAAVGAVGVRADKVLIGIGMIPRGEVGIIFAAIGLAEGVLGDDQYAALLMMVLATTLVTPPLLRWRLGDLAADRRSRGERTPDDRDDGDGVWDVAVIGDRIVLRGRPPSADAVDLALRVARLAPLANPDPTVVDWFGAHRGQAIAWRHADTTTLLDVLRHGDARSWRFLDVTGVLEDALPEVAAALARRRTDPGELDPTRVLHLETVEQMSGDSDVALLAALVSDVCATGTPDCAAALAQRLEPERSSTITAVVEGAGLLRAAAADPDAFDDRRVLQLVEHLGTASTASAAYRLATARLERGDWRRGALAELHERLRDELSRSGSQNGSSSPVEERRQIAIANLQPGDSAAEDRLRFAPGNFLLAHEPEEVARQARLVEPLARKGAVRVAVSPDPEPDRWRIDVACRDHDGLLARLSSALFDAELDVVSASLTTWPDGGGVDSFVVCALKRPRPRDLAMSMEARLRGRVERRNPPPLEVTFDNEAGPWHTACVVTCEDGPGVLMAIASAFYEAKVDVHAARLAGAADVVANRFEVTDRQGRKLSREAQVRVVKALAPRR